MDLLAYWRWDNYVQDLDEGAGFNFNSNQSRLHSAIELGERLWLVTGRRMSGGMRYILVASLQIVAKTHNSPDYKYGKFRLWADIKRSAYYSADGPDVKDLLLRLHFSPHNPIAPTTVPAQSLQTMRSLTAEDSNLLLAWANGLAREPRAYQIADEVALENAFEKSEDTLRETVESYHTGVSKQKKLLLQRSYARNRNYVQQLHSFYGGRCQLCGFDPELLYQVRVSCSHHIVYLSRGGPDNLQNLMLVCPNHHEVIHAVDAVFDFKDLCYVFHNGRREPLILNTHLQKAQS